MIQYNDPNINSIYYFISQMNTLVGKNVNLTKIQIGTNGHKDSSVSFL